MADRAILNITAWQLGCIAKALEQLQTTSTIHGPSLATLISEEYALQTLTAAAESLDMTDKQILAACRPEPQYYSGMTKSARRTCLWCGWRTRDSRYYRSTNTFVPEPIEQLEAHYMGNHQL